jgi:SWI/SNF-related matrix-associated actin-dependent regulator 1 of chromatin subfamily A
MIVRPARRLDWFTWEDPDRDWCVANAAIPGFQAGSVGSRLIVDFHMSHLSCVPEEVRDLALALPQPTRPVNDTLLRPYQAEDLAWLNARRGALLAYEMRLGKTPLACHLHDPASGILLIIAPLAAREAWREWVERTFNVGLCCLAGRTNIEEQPGYPAYFCHYDILGAHSSFFQAQKIGTFVLDECHMLQGRKTQRMSAVSLLAPRAEKVLGLSGTPMWNKTKSLYPILHLLMPGAWGTNFQFCSRYAGPEMTAYGWRFEGISNDEELRARLAYVVTRRTWEDVMPELPPTTRIIEPVELTAAQLTVIEAAAMKVSLAKGTTTVAGYLATLRRKLGEVKIKPAVVDARRARDEGHKVVLWCWHNEIAEKTVAALVESFVFQDNIFRLRSEDSRQVREREVQEFREQNSPCFLVANMGVGGAGIDLSCSDYAIFIELDWTPATVIQAAMRTFHKDRPQVLIFLQADCSVDANLVAALDIKNGFASSVGLSASDVMERML